MEGCGFFDTAAQADQQGTKGGNGIRKGGTLNPDDGDPIKHDSKVPAWCPVSRTDGIRYLPAFDWR